MKKFNDGDNFSAISTHKQYDCFVSVQQKRKAYLNAGLEAGAKAEADATMAAKQNTVFIIIVLYFIKYVFGMNCEKGFSPFFNCPTSFSIHRLDFFLVTSLLYDRSKARSQM